MKKSIVIFLIFLSVLKTESQTIDTLKTNYKLNYKPLLLSAGLITTGALLVGTKLNIDIQNKSGQIFGENFQTKTDNVTFYIPLAQIYAGRFFGFKPKNTIKHETIDVLTANTLTYLVVTILKNSVMEFRPDSSDQLSFPSGHTAIAFTNASLLYQEYKKSNFWYASSGFVFATATGILRIANNKHFTSDVLAGAGIGLASGLFISCYNPLQQIIFRKKNKTSAFIYPQFGNQIGIGALLRY